MAKRGWGKNFDQIRIPDQILFACSCTGFCYPFHRYARVYSLRRKSTLALRQRKAALLHQMAIPSQSIRASVVQRFGTCGKPACACHQGAKHGPYYYLTQCLAKGHIQKFLLKSPVQQEAAREATTACQIT